MEGLEACLAANPFCPLDDPLSFLLGFPASPCRLGEKGAFLHADEDAALIALPLETPDGGLKRLVVADLDFHGHGVFPDGAAYSSRDPFDRP